MVNISEFAARRPGSLIVLVFGFSVLATLIFWALLPASLRVPASDQTDYYNFYAPVARNVLAARGVTLEDGSPATLFPPGWPLILSGLFSLSRKLGISESFVLSTFAILTMGAISSLIFLMGRLVLSVSASLASAAIWMTYPFALWLTRQPNSEVPFMLFLYAGLTLFWYLILRRPRAWALFFLCGSLLGMAMLIRPIAIGIALVLSPIVWMVRRELPGRFRALLITMLLFGNLLTLLPWEAWVYSKTGNVISISTSGVENVKDGLILVAYQRRPREQVISHDIISVMQEIQLQLSESGQSYTEIGEAVATEFRTHPFAMTKLLALKAARSWYGTDSGRHEMTILLIHLAYLLIVLWSAGKVWRQGGMYRNFGIGIFLIAIYFWGMTVLAISIARYMVPVMGLLFILVGAALFPRSAAEARLAQNTRV